MKAFKNYQRDNDRKMHTCLIDVTIDTLGGQTNLDSSKNPYFNSLLENSNEMKTRIMLQSSDPDSDCFPGQIQFDLASRSIL